MELTYIVAENSNAEDLKHCILLSLGMAIGYHPAEGDDFASASGKVTLRELSIRTLIPEREVKARLVIELLRWLET